MIDFQNFLKEGVYDKHIFKAFFLAGGPGSGKSFIVGRTGLPALGFKVVNSDDAFELAMNKAKLIMDPDTIFSTQGQEIRDKAKKLTAIKMQGYITGRLGLVIDGTGKNVAKIQGQIKELRSIGYDVGMIYVNTDLDTAIARNDARPRSLPSTQVVTLWKEVQKNIGSFQSMFGSSFQVIDNSQDADSNKVNEPIAKAKLTMTTDIYNSMLEAINIGKGNIVYEKMNNYKMTNKQSEKLSEMITNTRIKQ